MTIPGRSFVTANSDNPPFCILKRTAGGVGRRRGEGGGGGGGGGGKP